MAYPTIFLSTFFGVGFVLMADAACDGRDLSVSAALRGCTERLPAIADANMRRVGVDSPRAVILVEGVSDQRALEALAGCRGRDLEAERVVVLPMGGAQAIDRFLGRFRPARPHVRLAGLCDAREADRFRCGLERADLGSNLSRADMERLGFYVCFDDLEDELIRALGVAGVERVVDAQGELGSFRTLQKQAVWRARPPEEQLRRFLGSGSTRKIRYGRLLVEALDPSQVPWPLDRVLAHV